jgi:acyl-CoA reductase-like NAD-dependent aldehyde dehydrogenase
MSTASVEGVGIDTRHWIGGHRVGSAGTFTDVSPVDERPVAQIARGAGAEVTAAVQAARQAFSGWAATPPEHRAKILNAIADGIGRRADELAQVETADNGALLRSHRRGVMPRDEATDVGPNITRAHLERVDGFVRRAVAAGARPLLGGTVNHDLGGLYYRPTLLTGAEPGSEILSEEVFGPVLTLQTFSGEDEAVAQANSTRYGLAATMFTGDRDRAERVSSRLVAGTVWVNCFFVRDLRAPFGGAGLSGIGREGGTWSFDFYADVKNTVYAPEGWRSDG